MVIQTVSSLFWDRYELKGAIFILLKNFPDVCKSFPVSNAIRKDFVMDFYAKGAGGLAQSKFRARKAPGYLVLKLVKEIN